jgi:transposase
MIQASKELEFMRYELTDCEWFAIKPLLPNKPRGVPRVDDRRVLNGIFWVLRSGAPWRDLPRSLGPYTTSYNSLCPLAAGWVLEPDHGRASHDA